MNNRRCKKCWSKKHLTQHHVLPQRHFHGEGPLVTLCRYCHDKIEKLIPFDLQPTKFYFDVVDSFMEA